MNRYTDTRKWENPSFRRLSPDAKLAYLYMLDICDNAGVFELDEEHVRFCTRKDADIDALIVELGDRLERLPNGHWWITRFVKFQLNDKPMRPEVVPAHAKMVRCLRAAGIAEDNPWITGRGLRPVPAAPIAGQPAAEQPELPGIKKDVAVAVPAKLDCPDFAEAWSHWLAYRRERKLTVLKPTSIKAQFAELESWGAERAVAAIRTSIRQNWQGIFEEKTNGRTNDSGGRNGRSFEQRGDYSAFTEKV